MTEQEVIELYNELVEHYGDALANFEHYPKTFAYQVRLYKYYKDRKKDENSGM